MKVHYITVIGIIHGYLISETFYYIIDCYLLPLKFEKKKLIKRKYYVTVGFVGIDAVSFNCVLVAVALHVIPKNCSL